MELIYPEDIVCSKADQSTLGLVCCVSENNSVHVFWMRDTDNDRFCFSLVFVLTLPGQGWRMEKISS